jgi:putative ABC transport system ATP-binding protein
MSRAAELCQNRLDPWRPTSFFSAVLPNSRMSPQSPAGSAAPAVRAVRLCKSIVSGSESLTILDQLDLDIAAGESVAIVGRSGSGKTTLLSLLAGLDTASAGEVWLAGQRLDRLDEDGRARLRAEQVGFVFQSFQLLGGFTALENVMLPAELAGRPQARERAESMLRQVGLDHRLQHYPSQLSGGEQQRVALARAFAAEPRVLFADEPTGNLDAQTGARIAELLFALNRERGTTLVFVTHDEQLASRCARTLRLHDGRLHQEPAGAG